MIFCLLIRDVSKMKYRVYVNEREKKVSVLALTGMSLSVRQFVGKDTSACQQVLFLPLEHSTNAAHTALKIQWRQDEAAHISSL